MSKKVLIIEDDPSFAEFLAVTVRAAGHLPHTSPDGAAGIEAFRSVRPDMVFLDLLVPKKDGFAVCEEIRSTEEGRRVPLVVLTGIYKKKEYRESLQDRFGVTDFLVKPVQLVDLWRLLDRYLRPAEEGAAEETAAAEPLPEHPAKADPFVGEPVRETPLVARLLRLHRAGKTGLLFLKDPSRVTILFLDKGSVVFARTNDPRHRLGKLLAEHGRVGRPELRRAEELLRKGPGGVRMGELLVGMGCLTEGELEEAVQEQLRGILLDAFRSEGWRAHFVEGELPSDEPIRIQEDTLNLILQGVREIPTPETIRRHLPSPSAILARAPGAEQVVARLGLTPYEQKMLSLFDGARSLRKVLSIGRLGPVDMERLTFAFLHTGVVEMVGGPAGEELPAPARGEGVRGAPGEAPAGGPTAPSVGMLHQTPLPRLLMELFREKRSGVLDVERGKEKAWLYVDGGRVVFAGSNDPHSRLGEVLVEGRLVTPEELARVVGEMGEEGPGPRIGQRLVDDGLLTLEELSWAMTFQMQRRVQDLFGWADGRYAFREEPFPTDEPITMGFNTPDVVLEGIRRMDPAAVASLLPPSGSPVARTADCNARSAQLKLTPGEDRLLGRLDRRSSVEGVLGLSDFEPHFLYRSLLAFLTLGLLEVREAGEEPAGAQPPIAAATGEQGQRPAPEGEEPTGPGAAAETVPRVLYEQDVSEREALRQQMFEVYREVETMHRCLAAFRDDVRTLRRSSLMNRLDPDVRQTMDSILESFLERVQGLGR